MERNREEEKPLDNKPVKGFFEKLSDLIKN